MRTRFPALMISLLLGACVAPGTPVPVKGDVQTLVGYWSGEYSSIESGRSGSIMFNFVAGTDTAQGDVLMIPAWPGPNYTSQYVPPEEPVSPPEPLRIQLVRVFGDQVAGQLSPYTDPDCGCQARTIFSGRLEGNTLDGNYHTYRTNGETVTGRWRVTRKQVSQQ